MDVALLALRITAGSLLAGHGAQKLWGVLGGYGPEGTGGWLESLGLKPGKPWAYLAGASEFASGALMALGLLTPIGAVSTFGPMLAATLTAHRGKPIWVSAGGAELPLVYMAVATALALAGPGRYSLDAALNLRVPKPLVALTAAGVAAGIVALELTREQPAAQEQAQARDETEAQGAAEREQEVGA